MSERKAIFLFKDLTLNGSSLVDPWLARPGLSGPTISAKGRIWVYQAIFGGKVLQRSHADTGQDIVLGLLRKRLAEG